MNAHTKTIAALTLVLTSIGCLPSAAVVQDAKLLEAGDVDATPFLSLNAGQTELGVKVGVGVDENVELQMGGGVTSYVLETTGWWLEAGPKFSLVEGALALHVPITLGNPISRVNTSEGTASGSSLAMVLGTSPTLIGSIDLSESVRLNPHLRVMYGLALGQDAVGPFMGNDILATLGASMSIELTEHVTLIPELSTYVLAIAFDPIIDGAENVLVGPGLGGSLYSGSLGLQVEF